MRLITRELPKYIDVQVEIDNTDVKLGLLDRDEARELLEGLEEAVYTLKSFLGEKQSCEN